MTDSGRPGVSVGFPWGSVTARLEQGNIATDTFSTVDSTVMECSFITSFVKTLTRINGYVLRHSLSKNL